MEAATNIIQLGTPIQNVVRVRPLLPDEPRDGDLRVVENNRKIVLIEPGKLQGTVSGPPPSSMVQFLFIDKSASGKESTPAHIMRFARPKRPNISLRFSSTTHIVPC